MTYFTDSPFEKMMMQKPQSGQGHKAPAPAVKKSKDDKPQPYRELIITPKKRSEKK